MRVVTFVEIDVTDELTFRFTYPSEDVYFDAIPTLQGINTTPAVVDPGVSIGQRESVSITFEDHLHTFDSESLTAGTFWTKFRARYPTIQGRPLRLIRGEVGQALEDMEARHYVVESYGVSDGATVTAKDPLKLLSSDRAQAPTQSTGELDAPVDADDASLTLSPSGIGDDEYPSSGKVCLGGKEIVSFTRSGDVLTITARGLHGTEGQEHDEGARVQLVLEYDSQTPSAIVADLLSYASVDQAWITIADWEATVDDYIGRLYSAVIPAPVGLDKLLNEVIEQAGLVIWWDTLAQQIKLKPLIPASVAFAANVDVILKDSYSATEQPDKRVSTIATYFGQRDATRRLDEESNYARVAVKITETDGDPALKKVFSRWINFDNRAAADRLNEMVAARYTIAPRRFNFELFRSPEAVTGLGLGLSVSHWSLVDGNGVEQAIAAQVISAEFQEDRVSISAEEMDFDDTEITEKVVYIGGARFNINLRSLYDDLYSAPESGDAVLFVVEGDATIGSHATDTPACDVGSWEDGVDLTLQIEEGGRIQGMGGKGGWAIVPFNVLPEDGGTALYTREPITIINNGKIYGGGGGGGRGGNSAGGGGAGIDPGPGFPGHPLGYGGSAAGTADAGGAGGTSGIYPGGDGGDPGQPGDDGHQPSPQAGGAAGAAVDGVSYVTYDVTGDVLGPQVN